MEKNAKVILNKALEIEDYLINIRRYIHKNAEVGYDTVKTFNVPAW